MELEERNVPDKKQKPKRFEEVLEKVGLFGPYQIFMCAVIQYISIQWAGSYSFMNNVGIVEPSWVCKDTRNYTYWVPKNRTEDSCNIINNCTNFSVYGVSDFVSVLEEFQLVCDNASAVKYIFLFYLIGQIIGSIIGGHIGDHLGRKTGFFTSQFCVIITSVMTTAATQWKHIAFVQLLNGFFLGIIEVTSITLMMEYTDSQYRLIPNAVFQWTFGYMAAALVAYLTGGWRLYLIFLNLLSAPVLLGFMLFQESPRWLIVKGKLRKGAQVLSEIAHPRWNRRNVDFDADDLSEIPGETIWRPYSFLHLFKTKKLAIQSVLQLLSMFTLSVMNDNYNTSIHSMPGSVFIHMMYFGLFRFWVPILIIYLDFKVPRFGRKTLFLCSLGLSIVCISISTILIVAGFEQTHPAIAVLEIIATLINESAFSMAVIQITAVAYPTVIRAIAFGCLHVTKYLGVIVDILVLDALRNVWSGWDYIIPLFFACVTFIAAVLWQPETKGRPLPDQIDDVM